MAGSGPWLAPLALGLGVWVIMGAVSEIGFRAKGLPGTLRTRFCAGCAICRVPPTAPRSAHIGVGVMVIGIVGTTAWQSEKIVAMKPG